MDDQKLILILSGDITQITEALASLTPPEVVRLQELELDGQQREDVFNAIEAFIDSQQSEADKAASEKAAADKAASEKPKDKSKKSAPQGKSAPMAPEQPADEKPPTANVSAEGAPSGKAARGEEIPDWQKPDYSGPLTIEKAEWRHRNIIRK